MATHPNRLDRHLTVPEGDNQTDWTLPVAYVLLMRNLRRAMEGGSNGVKMSIPGRTRKNVLLPRPLMWGSGNPADRAWEIMRLIIPDSMIGWMVIDNDYPQIHVDTVA